MLCGVLLAAAAARRHPVRRRGRGRGRRVALRERPARDAALLAPLDADLPHDRRLRLGHRAAAALRQARRDPPLRRVLPDQRLEAARTQRGGSSSSRSGRRARGSSPRRGRIVPSLIEVSRSEAFLDPSQPPKRARVFLDAIPTIRRVPTISTWPEIEDAAEGVLENGLYLGQRPAEVAARARPRDAAALRARRARLDPGRRVAGDGRRNLARLASPRCRGGRRRRRGPGRLPARRLAQAAGPPSPARPGARSRPRRDRQLRRAADLVGLGRAALNSFLVAAIVAPLTVLVSSWAGFALVLLRPRARTALLAASLLALMVPLTALLVPRFALYRSLGLVDTFVPLVAPALLGTSPIYVLVFYVAFRRLPPELYDACRLEAASPFQIWRRLAMPLVRPVAVAVGLLAFVFSWGNFLDPLVYLHDRDLFTLPLALRSLAQLDPTNYPLLLAGAVLATAAGARRCSSSPSATSSTSTAARGGSDDEHRHAVRARQGVRRGPCCPRARSRGRRRRAARRPRPVRVRQVDACSGSIAGLEEASAGRILIGERDVTRLAPGQPQRLDGLPELRALPAPDRRGEHRLRARRRARCRRPRCASASRAPPRSRAASSCSSGGRPSSRAASGSGSRSPARSCASPTSSSSTSRSRTSTRELRARTRAELKELHARVGATMLYVTHDQIEALTLGHRIAVLRRRRAPAARHARRDLARAREPLRRAVRRLAGDERPRRRGASARRSPAPPGTRARASARSTSSSAARASRRRSRSSSRSGARRSSTCAPPAPSSSPALPSRRRPALGDDRPRLGAPRARAPLRRGVGERPDPVDAERPPPARAHARAVRARARRARRAPCARHVRARADRVRPDPLPAVRRARQPPRARRRRDLPHRAPQLRRLRRDRRPAARSARRSAWRSSSTSASAAPAAARSAAILPDRRARRRLRAALALAPEPALRADHALPRLARPAGRDDLGAAARRSS